MLNQPIADRTSRPDPLASKTGTGGLVPSRAAVNYDFTSGVLPAGVTLTRASNAKFYNVAGILSTAANNNARFDYDPVLHVLKGLLIEPAGTNLILQSNDLSNASWVANLAPALTPNAAVSPDGTSDACTLGSSSVSGGAYQFGTTSTSTNYTISGYLKYVSGTSNFFVIGDDTVASTVGLSITGGVIAVQSGGGAVISSTCVPVGNGWYRFSVTFNSAANTGMSCVCFNETTNPIVMAVYGMQFEIGNVATSSMQSGASQATRVADQLSFTIPAGVSNLKYTFDDNSTQTVGVSPGAYNVPTNLNRPWIRSITSA